MRGWFKREFSITAKVYADCIRDDFASVILLMDGHKEIYERLAQELDEETAKGDDIDLAQIFRIETTLIELMPDDVIKAKIWGIRDRFERVVPKAARESYYASIPNKADWENGAFVKIQARTLLDIIHTNYLLNQGREHNITHLKLWIFGAFMATLCIVLGVLIIDYKYAANAYLHNVPAYGLVIVFGMLGAIISIVRRLQGAISRDTMEDDAVYELMNLENGHFAILSSIFSGGIFALLVYFLVLSGYLQEVTPSGFHAFIPISINHCSIKSETAAIAAPAAYARPAAKTESAENDDGTEAFVEKHFVKPLMLDCITSFFKMLVLAFLAGFAERLVPDVLDRIVKKASETK